MTTLPSAPSPPSSAASSTTATLLVSCPDRKGIVAALAQLLYGHGANILDADQHTDPVAGSSSSASVSISREMHTDRVALERAHHRGRRRASGCAGALLRDQREARRALLSHAGPLPLRSAPPPPRRRAPCEIALIVIATTPISSAIARALRRAVPRAPGRRRETRTRRRRAARAARGDRIDLVVLARYMQILSPRVRRRARRRGSSTSTTRSCPRSSAASPTTRPTSAA